MSNQQSYSSFEDEKIDVNDIEQGSIQLPLDKEDAIPKQTHSKISRGFAKFAKVLAIGFVAVHSVSYLSNSGYLNSDDKEFSIKELSDAYLNVLTHSNLAGEWLEKYTSEVHLAGTNYELAQFTADKFEEYGFDSSIEAHNVYINYPKEHALKLLEKKKNSFEVTYEPTLVEDKLKEDPTTIGDDLVPAFHGYSANGNVTGPIVFANYGSKEDFRLLEAKGVNVKGSVVIVRYGKIFRGLKVKFAQEAGAIGVVIYSDPADDYVPKGVKAYPDGPGRNPSSIQRGSVQFLSSLPGDPARFTDGSAEALANLSTIPRIPSLPISYKEAEPILKTLNGHGLDLGFKGDIPSFQYTTGPSVSQLNLYNNNDYNFTDIWNVHGLIEGEDSSKVIVIGNHRDAWVKGGAVDPNSGSATLLEVARGFHELFKLGWQPRYSLLLASWDGEEYGLLGSTAYAEKYASELGKKAIGYINLDSSVSGSHLRLSASPLLNQYLLNIADQVKYPRGDYSLKTHFLNESQINILGSGSDYTSFFEHLGITSVDFGFTNGPGDPVYHYHSNYDSFHWVSKFADPGFKFHNAFAQYLGLLIINLSEEKLLKNYNAEDYSVAVKTYFDELVEKIPADWFGKKVTLDEDDYTFPELRSVHGSNHHDHHNFTLANLVQSTNHDLKGFIKVSHRYDNFIKALQIKWEEEISKSKNPIKKFFFNRKVNHANDKLKDLEKNFLYEKGLNGRDWFKHVVFASGRYTGYAGQKLPGLTEAIEDNDFEQSARWIGIIRHAIKKGLVSLV